MLVTLLGIVMLVRFVQPENAPPPMFVTLLGIIEFLQPKSNVFVAVKIIALQLSRESKYVFSFDTIIFSNFGQYSFLQNTVYQ